MHLVPNIMSRHSVYECHTNSGVVRTVIGHIVARTRNHKFSADTGRPPVLTQVRVSYSSAQRNIRLDLPLDLR